MRVDFILPGSGEVTPKLWCFYLDVLPRVGEHITMMKGNYFEPAREEVECIVVKVQHYLFEEISKLKGIKTPDHHAAIILRRATEND
jgi:hypothetical protein